MYSISRMFSNKCINIQAKQLVNFTDQNITDRVVTVQPIEYGPFLFASVKNEAGSFFICGPMFNLMKEFAIKYNTNLQIKSQPDSLGEMISECVEENTDILLTVTKPNNYLEYSKQLSLFGMELGHSYCIDFIEMGTFVSKVYYGSTPLFQFFNAFNINVWLLILVTILILAFVSSVNKLPCSFDIFWNYFTLLFSKSIQKSLKRLHSKLILGVWLMSANYLAILFTAFLLDYMIMAPPIIKLDNLEQFVQRKVMKITTNELTTLGRFALYSEADLAKKLNKKLITYEFSDWRKDISTNLASRLRNGSLAYSEVRAKIIYSMAEITQFEILDENEPKLTDLLHISEETGGLEPYFLFINKMSKDWVHRGINHVITISRESGLYTKWILDVLEYYREQIGSIDKKTKVKLFDFSVIELKNILDIFYLTYAGLLISVVILIIEFFARSFIECFYRLYLLFKFG